MKKSTILYGIGNWVDIHYMWIKNNFNITGVFDRNPEKRKRAEEAGWKFLSEDELKEQSYDNILLGSVREEEIKKYLIEDLNIEKEIISGNQMYYEEWIKKEGTVICNGNGRNSDKTFLIIGPGEKSLAIGLMNLFTDAVFGAEKAAEHNWIPVIDLKNYYTCYHESILQVGHINPWEYFFCQPNNFFTLEDALESQNQVYMTEGSRYWENIFQRFEAVYDDKIHRWQLHRIYEKAISLSEYAKKQYIYYKKLLFNKKAPGKTLAVFIRGTDYTEGKAYMHPIQPSLEQVADKVRSAISEWGGENYLNICKC